MQKWQGRYSVNGKRISVGYFDSAESAKHALDSARGPIVPSGKHAIVSDEDYEWAAQFGWYQMKNGYAARHVGLTLVYMHVEIAERMGLDVASCEEIDHENVNKLDNQRSNLRPLAGKLNRCNLPVRRDSKTGVRGVYWDRHRERWVARVGKDRKSVYQKRFSSFADAVAARKQAAQEWYEGFSYVDRKTN